MNEDINKALAEARQRNEEVKRRALQQEALPPRHAPSSDALADPSQPVRVQVTPAQPVRVQVTPEAPPHGEMAEGAATDRYAWSPTAIAWVLMIFSVVPAGILYALNFERLGQPHKKPRTLFFVLLGSTVYYGIIAWTSLYGSIDPLPRAWFLMVNIFLAWRFYLGQQQLFAQHMRRGGRKASLLVPLVVSVISTLVLAGGAVGIAYWEASRAEARYTSTFEYASKLMEQGDYKRAEASFKVIKERDPSRSPVYWNLAVIYMETDRPQLAKQEIESLLEQEPDNEEAKNFLKDIEETIWRETPTKQ